MTRRLPWKSPAKINSEAASSPLRTPKSENSGFPVASPRTTPRTAPQPRRLAPLAHTALDSSDPIRSPSTSPPPEPPEEQFMMLGDDRYRMVEDELLQTAQRFTTHLHRAEYTRLKAQAKSQNAAAIREIERPVVLGSTPTTAARNSRVRSKQLAKQRSMVSSGEPAARGLRGMLDAPRDEQRLLPRQATASMSASAGSTTRAAAGYRSHGSVAVKRENPGEDRALPQQSNRWTVNMSPGVGPSSAAVRSRQTPATPMELDAETEGDDSDDVVNMVNEDDQDDPFGVARRRINRQKSREQLKRVQQRPPPAKKPTSDTMPHFI